MALYNRINHVVRAGLSLLMYYLSVFIFYLLPPKGLRSGATELRGLSLVFLPLLLPLSLHDPKCPSLPSSCSQRFIAYHLLNQNSHSSKSIINLEILITVLSRKIKVIINLTLRERCLYFILFWIFYFSILKQ